MFGRKLRLEVYCPVCASRREMAKHQPQMFKHLFQSLGTAFAGGSTVYFLFSLTAAFWSSIFIFIGTFLTVEFFEYQQSRKELICPVCDFDPVLYRRSPGLARDRVLKRVELRKRWVEHKVKLRLQNMGELG